MDFVETGLIRALCFFDGIGYPPTRTEWFSHWDGGVESSLPSRAALEDARIRLLDRVQEMRGRVVFMGREALIVEHEKCEAFFPRKLRRAQSVARWLRRLEGVRFVALCNTTALMHARDKGDLDFFVVTHAGMLWQTRAWGALPFKLLRRRPEEEERDAVCLSFFVDDSALDLSLLQLPQDVYFRHWFLSLLPLYDDGISHRLWGVNEAVRNRHPVASPWILNPSIGVPSSILQLPMPRVLEGLVHALQEGRFPSPIRSLLNRDTRVVADDHVLKFHVEDGREHWQKMYEERCRVYGVEA